MLTAHLYKEWREQRAMLLGCTAALLALAGGFGALAPARLVPADVEVWFVILALGLGLVGLAGDLVPGEARRGQLGFLLRTPGALRFAFVAKLALLGGGLAALLGVGLLAGWICDALAGAAERTESMGQATIVIAGIAVGIAVTAPWAFAVSCWTPRGASVLPATGLTLAAVVAPSVLVAATYGPPVNRGEVFAAISLVFVGGIVAAWLSFVRGLRFGRRLATVGHGLLAALVFVVPSWTWSAERAWSWHHADPGDAEMRLGGALLGGDLPGGGGRTLFVSAFRDWGTQRVSPHYALVVDLPSGAWRQDGAAMGTYLGSGALDGNEWLRGLLAPQPWILRCQLDHRGQDVVGRTLLDGGTGRAVADVSDGAVPDRFAERLAAAARATTPFRLPDGGRAWFEGRTVVFEAADGGREVVPWPDGVRPGLTAGMGFPWWPIESGRPPRLFDLTRRRTIELGAADRHLEWYQTLVRPGRWLIEEKGDPTQRAVWLVDPDSGARERLALGEGEVLQGVTGDGRVLVAAPGRTLARIDPEAGRREELRVVDGRAVHAVSQADWRTFRVPTRTPDGRDVIRVWLDPAGPGRRAAFARLDGSVVVPTCSTDDDVALVGIPDDDHLLVIRDRRRIERWRFGSDAVEVVFAVGG